MSINYLAVVNMNPPSTARSPMAKVKKGKRVHLNKRQETYAGKKIGILHREHPDWSRAHYVAVRKMSRKKIVTLITGRFAHGSNTREERTQTQVKFAINTGKYTYTLHEKVTLKMSQQRLINAGIKLEKPWKGCCKRDFDVTSPCDVCQTPSCKVCLMAPKRNPTTNLFMCSSCSAGPVKDNCEWCPKVIQEEEELLHESGLVMCRHYGGWECREKAVKLAIFEREQRKSRTN
jgi:hypothetical protein